VEHLNLDKQVIDMHQLGFAVLPSPFRVTAGTMKSLWSRKIFSPACSLAVSGGDSRQVQWRVRRPARRFERRKDRAAHL